MASTKRAVDAALDAIYTANYDRIYRLCLAYLRDPEDAAEAAQEVFARAVPLAGDLEDPRGWLYRVARNHCRDQLRQRTVRSAVHKRGGGTPEADPERQALARHALRAAFASLTDRERQALGRAVLLDRPLRSVADDMGVSYLNAAQLVSRARRRAAVAAGAVVAIGAVLGARIAVLRERAASVQASLSASRPQAVATMAAAAVLCASTAAGISRPDHHSVLLGGGSGAIAPLPAPARGPATGAAASPADPRPASAAPAAVVAVAAPGHAALPASSTTNAAAGSGGGATPAPAPQQDSGTAQCGSAQVSVGVSPDGGSVSVCSSP